MVPFVDVRFGGDKGILAGVKDKNSVTAEVKLRDEIRAPVKKGDIIGSVIYRIKDEVLWESPIFADSDAEEIKVGRLMRRILTLLFAPIKEKTASVT